LRLPNVMSLRALGLGLGHELTLMTRSDLFIGTSSGFAAMANFCEVPYFITHMNRESCNAYAIPEGASRLPFAAPNQELIYEPESTEMLFGLLDRGLALPPRGKAARNEPTPSGSRVRMSTEEVVGELEEQPVVFDISAHDKRRRAELVPSATTSRYFIDDTLTDLETAYLVRHRVEQALDTLVLGDKVEASAMAARFAQNFPRLVEKYPDLKRLYDGVKPPITEVVARRAKNELLSISGNSMPRWMQGTIIHKALKRVKDFIAGYDRR
jgi:hypothetical protein